MKRHCFQMKGVALVDRKWDHPLAGDTAGYVARGWLGQVQLSESRLDGDLPGARRREEDGVAMIRDQTPRARVQTLRFRKPPEPAVRVDQEVQPSKPRKNSSGRGSSKSSATRSRPRSCPEMRS